MPAWTMSGHAGLLAIDSGGTNIRAGVVALHLKTKADLSKAEAWRSETIDQPRWPEPAGLQPGKRSRQTVVIMHNDAVGQGLSEVPRMQDVKEWASSSLAQPRQRDVRQPRQGRTAAGLSPAAENDNSDPHMGRPHGEGDGAIP